MPVMEERPVSVADLLEKGTFLTDGKRLVQVRRLLTLDRVVVEDAIGALDKPLIDVLPIPDVRAGWRVVKMPDDGGATDRWITEYQERRVVETTVPPPTVCGCVRCVPPAFAPDEVKKGA